MKPVGIRTRLTITLLAGLTITMALYGYFRFQQEKKQLMEETQRKVAVTAKAIQIAVENALRDRQISDIRNLASELVEYQTEIDRIRLFDDRLRPIITSNPLKIGEEVPKERLIRVISIKQPMGFFQERDGHKAFYYLVPIRNRDGSIRGAMEVVHLATLVEKKLRAATHEIVARVALLSLVIGLIVWFTVKRNILQPIGSLVEGVLSFSHGNLRQRIPVRRKDEIGHLATEFNQMAENLQRAYEQILTDAERKLELERRAREVEKLAAVGRLTAGLAHEIGTPLNIVSGRAEFLLSRMSEGDPRSKNLKVILEQIDRIAKIVQQLLGYARPQKPEMRPVAIDQVIGKVLSFMDHEIKAKGVKVKTELSKDLSPIAGDENLLQQVFVNLILNSLHAMSDGGVISLRVSMMMGTSNPGYILVEIEDNGCGITPEDLPRIFDPFFSTKKRGEGTGLGLSVTYGIIRDHGGSIEVKSHVGKGTTFLLRLPIFKGEPSENETLMPTGRHKGE